MSERIRKFSALFLITKRSYSMYPSCETRWFFLEAPESLIAWFASGGRRFDGPENAGRTDHYLLVAGGDNIGVKLREGNIEAKHRVKCLGEWQFPAIGARGEAEHWIKWSFRLEEADSMSRRIIREGADDWIAVAKERLGYTYHLEKGGVIRERAIHDWAPEGCQVELTRIQVKGKTYYTFGLEAFSESGYLEDNLRRGTKTAFSAFREWREDNGWRGDNLGFRESRPMGYPAFLLEYGVQG